MESHEGRLDSLRETGEKLIKDAEYHDATAKGIRDQVNDFGTCWKDITESIKERKAMVSDVILHYKVTAELSFLSYFEKICQWCERMYLCGFVSLYVRMFVARANKVEGTMS